MKNTELLTPINSEIKELSKQDITKIISKDNIFKKILNTFKVENKTNAFSFNIENEYKNGLSTTGYFITNNKQELISIIIPIFSTENTITWDIRYFNNIKTTILEHCNIIDDSTIIDNVICPLYKYDKWTNNLIFMQCIKLNDWLNNGMKGKNGYSVYFRNDNLPNKFALSITDIRSDSFVKLLPIYSKKELKLLMTDYANKWYKRFNNDTKRSDEIKIKNIANGLYAQILVYLQLKKDGHNVTLDWTTDDDLGIDIIYNINNKNINIDVKSTKTKELKITKNRKETHFYAVCDWKKSEPQLLGFLFKFNFWKSKLINSIAPEFKNDMYIKSLDSVKQDFITIDNLFTVLHNYEILKLKKGEHLFNND